MWTFARLICKADVFGRGCHNILIAVGFCPFGIFYVAVNLIEYSALEYSCVGYVPSTSYATKLPRSVESKYPREIIDTDVSIV